MTYTVGQMAKMLGLAGSTLRYYDKEGLLPFVERSSGGGSSAIIRFGSFSMIRYIV